MLTIGLICAVPQESSALIRKFPSAEKSHLNGLRTWTFNSGINRVVLMESGIGAARSRTATSLMIEFASPDLIINFGFCGAIRHDLHVGDLVVAEQIHLLSESGPQHEESLHPENIYLTSASQHRCLLGNFITTEIAITKKSLHPKLNSDMHYPVLEMESTFVGRTCREAGTRFAAIRSVSDTSTEEPYHLFKAISASDYTITAKSITVALLRKPGLIPHLFYLGRNAGIAGRSLAGQLQTILERL